MRHALPLACLLLTTLVAAPAVQAQVGPMQAVFTMRQPSLDDLVLTPNLEQATLQIDWAYSMTTVGSPALVQGQTAVLHWHLEPESCDAVGVTFLGAMEETIQFPMPWLSGILEGTSVFGVRLSDSAPGEVAISCTLRGSVGSVGIVPPTAPAASAFQVTGAYDGGITANARHRIADGAAGSTLRFPIGVANLANSESKVTAVLASELPAGWAVSLPEPVVLESVNKGGIATNLTFIVEVKIPRGAESGTAVPLLVRLEAGSIKDPAAQAESVVVSLIAGVRGASTDSAVDADDVDDARGKVAPGAGPLLLIGLLALAFVVRRRAV